MDPITAITLAKGIASATGLDGWLKNKLGGAVGEKAADQIANIATMVTGAATAEDALMLIQQDATTRDSVREKLVNNEHELVMAQLHDVQSAREMYSSKNEMADKIATQVINQNHFTVALLLAANGVVLYLVEDKTIALALGNLIGTSIGALWHERQQVIGFFFGSSLGSKIKTARSHNPWTKDA